MQNARQSKFPRQLWPLLSVLAIILSACAPSSGIFASGAWQAATLQHEHIRSLAVDPNNPQIIYAGDAQDGVFVSANGGTTLPKQQKGATPRTTIHPAALAPPRKEL